MLSLRRTGQDLTPMFRLLYVGGMVRVRQQLLLTGSGELVCGGVQYICTEQGFKSALRN